MVERVGSTAVVVAGLVVFAAGLAWASTAEVATGYTEIAMQMLLLGGGLGLTTAPATSDHGIVIRRQGRRRLGRQRHHARNWNNLGVAIVGSVFASVYSAGLSSASALAGLPVDVRSAMERSMALSHRVIGQIPAAHAADIRNAVNHAFLDGLQVARWSAPVLRWPRR